MFLINEGSKIQINSLETTCYLKPKCRRLTTA